MRILLTFAAVAVLAGCSEPAPEPTPTQTATAPEPVAAEGVAAGTYEFTGADGETGTTTINADGTYSVVMFDGTESGGTYARRNGMDCFDPDGDETELCWSVGEPAADGSFTSTSTEGETVTVRPQAAAAAAAPAPAPAPVAQ